MQELSDVLARGLGRVEAPPELWDRVRWQKPPAGGPRVARSMAVAARKPKPLWWAAAALATVAIAVVAGRGLLDRDLHSSDPARVREWVFSKSGLSVPLPQKLPSSVRILSASQPDKTSAQIKYQVNGQEAVLLVSVASAAVAGDGRHRFLSRDQHTSSWTMRGLVYTASCANGEVTQVACQLCHSL